MFRLPQPAPLPQAELAPVVLPPIFFKVVVLPRAQPLRLLIGPLLPARQLGLARQLASALRPLQRALAGQVL
jgi:hypothetical protein